jgi:Flp pilus assembly protein TadD
MHVLHSMGLRRTHQLAPDNARYAYVYAVALDSTGAHSDALALLEQTHRQHPADGDVLFPLVSVARDAGNLNAALLHARELVDRYPADPQFRALLQELQRQQAH